MDDIAYEIKEESPVLYAAIRHVTQAALAPMSFSSGAEPNIIETLRAEGDLSLSLVAIGQGALLGHCAFSPVDISDAVGKWYALGPVAVRTADQRKGIGRALIAEGLSRMKTQGAQGCVVIGNPKIYTRFGFQSDGQLIYGALDKALLQRIIFQGAAPAGHVSFASAFDLDRPQVD